MEKNQLLFLKNDIESGEANAESFEKAIAQEGLTCEIIILLADFYKNDIEGWKK